MDLQDLRHIQNRRTASLRAMATLAIRRSRPFESWAGLLGFPLAQVGVELR
jgi:hypothetical protein